MAADVIVVGGGCMGASIAWHLQTGGARVVVLERGHLAQGASGHSGALIRRHYEHPVGLALAAESLRFFETFRRQTGRDPGFVRARFTTGARRRDLSALRRLLSLQRRNGVAARLVTPSTLEKLEPSMRVDDLAAGVVDDRAGYADPVATTLAFADAAKQAGAEIRESANVHRLLLARGEVAGVRTNHGTLRAPRVIVAAGNGTPQVLSTARVHLPIRFVRGEVAILRRPPDFGRAPGLHFDYYHNTYSRPDGVRDTLVGYLHTDLRTSRARPEPFDATLRESTAKDLRARLASRFPGFARAQLHGGWAGLYDVTPDRYPILGPCGPSGLFVAAGFSGHGFKLCPAVGRLLAHAVLGEREESILRALAADRFSRNALIRPVASFPNRGRRLP